MHDAQPQDNRFSGVRRDSAGHYGRKENYIPCRRRRHPESGGSRAFARFVGNRNALIGKFGNWVILKPTDLTVDLDLQSYAITKLLHSPITQFPNSPMRFSCITTIPPSRSKNSAKMPLFPIPCTCAT